MTEGKSDFENEFANRSDYFNHRTGLFMDMDKWVSEKVKSERNKTIDEMLEKLDKGYKDYVWYKHLRKEINSLKT